jgi:hypothetical protein
MTTGAAVKPTVAPRAVANARLIGFKAKNFRPLLDSVLLAVRVRFRLFLFFLFFPIFALVATIVVPRTVVTEKPDQAIQL